MRVGFDLRPFLRQATGVGIYYKNLLFALSQIDRDNHYYLFSSSYKDRFLSENLPPFVFREFRDFRYPVKALDFFWQRWGWPPLDRFFQTRLDLTHSPTPLVLPTSGCKVVTVHDLFFLDHPSMVDGETRRNFVRGMAKSLERADGILVVSQSVRDQVVERFYVEEEKIKVVYHGVDAAFFKKPSEKRAEEVRKSYGLPSSFLLFVGTIEPRKNLTRLVEALSNIHQEGDRISLVFVGKKGSDYRRLVSKIDELNLKSSIFFLDYVPDQDLPVFYHLASCLVFPSLCEGFGFPLLEAMAGGLPLVVSKAPAIPEVARDAALYFDPEDPGDLANRVMDILNNEELRKSLVEKGFQRIKDFDWKITAEKTLEFYGYVMERSSRV